MPLVSDGRSHRLPTKASRVCCKQTRPESGNSDHVDRAALARLTNEASSSRTASPSLVRHIRYLEMSEHPGKPKICLYARSMQLIQRGTVPARYLGEPRFKCQDPPFERVQRCHGASLP